MLQATKKTALNALNIVCVGLVPAGFACDFQVYKLRLHTEHASYTLVEDGHQKPIQYFGVETALAAAAAIAPNAVVSHEEEGLILNIA